MSFHSRFGAQRRRRLYEVQIYDSLAQRRSGVSLPSPRKRDAATIIPFRLEGLVLKGGACHGRTTVAVGCRSGLSLGGLATLPSERLDAADIDGNAVSHDHQLAPLGAVLGLPRLLLQSTGHDDRHALGKETGGSSVLSNTAPGLHVHERGLRDPLSVTTSVAALGGYGEDEESAVVQSLELRVSGDISNKGNGDAVHVLMLLSMSLTVGVTASTSYGQSAMLSSMTKPQTVHDVRFLLIRRLSEILFDALIEDEDLENEDRGDIEDGMEELAALCLDAMLIEVVSMGDGSRAHAVIELDDSGIDV